MPKYYLWSGDLKTVMDAPTALIALDAALTRESPEALGVIVQLSEQGFDDPADARYMSTVSLLKTLGRLAEEPEASGSGT